MLGSTRAGTAKGRRRRPPARFAWPYRLQVGSGRPETASLPGVPRPSHLCLGPTPFLPVPSGEYLLDNGFDSWSVLHLSKLAPSRRPEPPRPSLTITLGVRYTNQRWGALANPQRGTRQWSVVRSAVATPPRRWRSRLTRDSSSFGGLLNYPVYSVGIMRLKHISLRAGPR